MSAEGARVTSCDACTHPGEFIGHSHSLDSFHALQINLSSFMFEMSKRFLTFYRRDDDWLLVMSSPHFHGIIQSEH